MFVREGATVCFKILKEKKLFIFSNQNLFLKCCSLNKWSWLHPPVSQYYIWQHGFYSAEIYFNKTYCISVSRPVCYVSITQGQTRSSSFRTHAVSAFTAHRLISLMQSKHVINGPSQPALFVVRQTLKSNVSTMGGMKICWHGRSADVRFFRLHAKNVFYFASFSFFDPTWKGRFFC